MSLVKIFPFLKVDNLYDLRCYSEEIYSCSFRSCLYFWLNSVIFPKSIALNKLFS